MLEPPIDPPADEPEDPTNSVPKQPDAAELERLFDEHALAQWGTDGGAPGRDEE